MKLTSRLSTLLTTALLTFALFCALLPSRHREGMAVATPAAMKVDTPQFVEIAAKAGVRYTWRIEGKPPWNILQTIGNGCAFLDFDGDGNLDILLVGTQVALFRGDGRGHFTDVSHETGLDRLKGHFLGCAVGDYDNDGFPDIYLTGFRGGILLHNENVSARSTQPPGNVAAIELRRRRQFRDVTAEAGIKSQPWGSSATFADLDGDGKLDLYIGNYVHFGPEVEPQLCDLHGILTSCGPFYYKAETGACYRNLGGGKFQDVTHAWGLNRVTGKALAVSAAPTALVRTTRQSAPGDLSLGIVNDQVPADLMLIHNNHARNVGDESGIALSDGQPYAGMGIDWGDYDNDGLLDIAVSTFQNQAKCIFHNIGGAFEMGRPEALGMMSAVPRLSFGVKWIDYDNDGWLDLIYANGHVQDNIAAVDRFNNASQGAVYRQPVTLYRNLNGKRFTDSSDRMSKEALKPIVGRGLAIGDFDNDGRMDALIVDSEGNPLLLHNLTAPSGHWLLFNLVGTRSNRDGYGAILVVETRGRRLTRYCHSDGSYMSASDKRVHFGLGTAQRVDRLTVRWPSGITDIYTNLPVDHIMTLREGTVSKRTVVQATHR